MAKINEKGWEYWLAIILSVIGSIAVIIMALKVIGII